MWRPVLALALGLVMSIAARAADSYAVVHVYPHDRQAFTQGLVFVDGQLYESTGREGHSSLRLDVLETGQVLQRYDLPREYFAEGLTNSGSTLVQLTWTTHTGFVYDRFSFRVLRTFHFDGEGWGLTNDGKSLILSDGTPWLRFLNPKTFKVMRRVEVTENGNPVKELNELEYIHGQVWANIWHSDKIARISPVTGKVLGWIDLAGLDPEDEGAESEAVLNGIAYDAQHDRIFVTGKLWSKLFEIRVVPARQKANSR